uniref:Protein zyg-11 homolog (Trinotate prediction) n=1 Tax=Henneguya salminicola TaxID=69463 RepID=A0A6G3MGR4_HENSL
MCKDSIISKAVTILSFYQDFEYLKCMKLCFGVIHSIYPNNSNPCLRMAVAICSILASRIHIKHTKEIAESRNIQVLINIVQSKSQEQREDNLLYHSIICLWNMTDECPVACARFIEWGGLQCLSQLHKNFQNVQKIDTKIFGLLNNIAEISTIRHFFLKKNIIRMLLRNAQKGTLPSSFFACGILANILICWVKFPDIIDDYNPNDIETILCKTVNNFGIMNTKEIVVYRSFIPFNELLNSEIYASQWWAIWSIRHVTKLQKDKYVPLIKNEVNVIQAIRKNLTHEWEGVRFCAKELLDYLS